MTRGEGVKAKEAQYYPLWNTMWRSLRSWSKYRQTVVLKRTSKDVQHLLTRRVEKVCGSAVLCIE